MKKFIHYLEGYSDKSHLYFEHKTAVFIVLCMKLYHRNVVIICRLCDCLYALIIIN